jgi:WD40 repeat protein
MLNAHRGKITAICHEPQQTLIATASTDCTVKIWDPRSSNSNPILTFQQHQKEVNDIAISPDGRWIASAGKEGYVKIWEIDTGKMIKELKSSQ